MCIGESRCNLSYIEQQQKHILKQRNHRRIFNKKRKNDDEISHFFKSIIPWMVKIRRMKSSNIKNVQLEIKNILLKQINKN